MVHLVLLIAIGVEKENFDTLIWNQKDVNKAPLAVYALHGGAGSSNSLQSVGCGAKQFCDVLYEVHLRDDKIKMIVDVPNNELIYFSIKQNKELGRYTNIDYDISYRFAASLTGGGESIKLLDVN